MRPIIAIRTHRWSEEEERLLAALRGVAGHDLAVVFHNRPAGLALPLDVIDIGEDWLAANGLRAVPDWGWRCGDYFYYALRAARPARPFYWLVEPDVFFHGEANDFFARFAGETADALGYRPGPYTAIHAFARGLPDLPLHQAVFALTRLSGRAIDRLAELRRAYGRRAVQPRFYTNDELFVFSNIAADPGLTIGALEAAAPDWFDGVTFAPSPDLLAETVAATRPSRVFHPVLGRASFKRALAARIGAEHAFLRNQRTDIARLDDAEIEDVVAMVAERARAELRFWQARGARPRRRRRA